MAASMATSLSHRLCILPKTFSVTHTNRPISVSFPILNYPSLSLTKIHCSPPEEGEDNETYSDEEPFFPEEEPTVSEQELTVADEQPIVSNKASNSMFQGPLFDEYEEDEEEIGMDYEMLYGPAFSGVTYFDGDVDEMDYVVGRGTDKFNNLITRRPTDDFEEVILELRVVSRTVKGGRNMSYRSVVAIGDRKGNIGIGVGKALEMNDAVVKAVINGRQNVISVPITKGLTFPHRASGRFAGAEIMLRPAAPGSGVLAGGMVTKILDLMGLKNAIGKQIKTRTPLSNAMAVIVACKKMRSYEQVSRQRGISINEMKYC